jgi:arylsulfatase A-like enzyme
MFHHSEADVPLSDVFREGVKELSGGEYDAFKSGRHVTLNDAKRDYDGAVHWVDSQIGRLVNHLQTNGKINDTMIVITADHGHNFGEHGIYFDNASLYDTSIKVPLVIWHPKYDTARIGAMVQHTDIMPTILQFLGKEVPAGLEGNVLPGTTRDEVIAEAYGSRFRMIRTGRWKYIEPVGILQHVPDNVRTWYTGDGKPELYDIVEDPNELNNLADSHPQVVVELKGRLSERIKQFESRRKLGSKLQKLKKK